MWSRGVAIDHVVALAQSYCGRLKMLKPRDSPGVQWFRLLGRHDTPPNAKRQNVLKIADAWAHPQGSNSSVGGSVDSTQPVVLM